MFRKIDSVYIIILTIVTGLLWLPTIHTPYWWDSAGFVIQTAHKFVNTGFFPLTSEFTQLAHPTLFPLILALAWKMFGESLFVSHLLNFFFTLLAVLGVYYVGKELIKDKNTGRLMGLLGGLLLLFTPVFLAQIGIIYMEIPLAAFALWGYYFYLKRRFSAYAVTAGLLVLTKEVGVLFVLFIVVLHAVTALRKSKTGIIALVTKESLLITLPLIVLFGWFSYHSVVTGWWLVAPELQETSIGTGIKTLGFNINLLFGTLKFVFFGQWRVLLIAGIVLPPLISFFKSSNNLKKVFKSWQAEKVPLLIIPIIYTLFFAKTHFLFRYCIVALPFLYLAALYSLITNLQLLKAKRIHAILLTATSVLLLLFYFNWNNHRQISGYFFAPLEDNLEYLDVIKAGTDLSRYFEQEYPKAKVYASFPVNYMLMQPHQQYVAKPIQVIECANYKKGDKVDFIVLHPFSPGEVKCLELAQQLQFRIFKKFSVNGKDFVLAKGKGPQ